MDVVSIEIVCQERVVVGYIILKNRTFDTHM